MYLNEDALTKWVEINKGLCITRSINNLNNFNFNKKYNYPVILTGYDKVIQLFFDNIIKKIQSKIVLILIESDNINITIDKLENDKILHCFSWNTTINHNKLTTLPIGLNFKRQYKPICNYIIENKINENIINNCKKLVCFNCDLNTSNERKILKNIIDKNMKDFCEKLPYIPFKETKYIPSYIEGTIKIDITDPKCYNDWIQYKFILSPEGAGLDCHRTWEAIIIGVIPIVKSSMIDNIFKDLPVVIVKSWDELSIDFLDKQYDEIMKNKMENKYNYKKLYMKYWSSMIEDTLYVKPKILQDNDIYFITYGDEKYGNAKLRLCNQANEVNIFKQVKSFGKDNLTKEFKEKYIDILNQPRGGGYWVWKLDILEQTINNIKEGDFIVYLDAGCNFNKYGKQRFYDYISMFENNDYGILSFQMHNQLEKYWTTKEIFKYFKCENDNTIIETGQYLGGVFILQKNEHSKKYLQLFKECIEYDKNLITDVYNKNGNQYPYFKDNRHDQSITSIIRKQIGSIVIPKDESWILPFGSDNSFYYPFWATRSKQ
jgi:hypothetical protein